MSNTNNNRYKLCLCYIFLIESQSIVTVPFMEQMFRVCLSVDSLHKLAAPLISYYFWAPTDFRTR